MDERASHPPRFRRGDILLGILLLASVWCRITSLETSLPAGHDADGAFFGVQAERLSRGQAIELKTGGGKPVDPLYILAETPLHWFAKPSFVIQRLPAVGFGLLAIGLLYAFSARMLDRETAVIGSALLACVPIGIVYGRIGWEYSEVPAACVLVIFAALRNRYAALMLAYMFGLHISPTMLMMAPVPAAILLGGWFMDVREGRREEAKSRLGTLAVLCGFAALYGVLMSNNPQTKVTLSARFAAELPRWDLGVYLTLFMRQLLGYCHDVGRETGPLLFWSFWSPIALATSLGTVSLMRRGRWDLVGLVAGWGASVLGYFVVAGPVGFHPLLARYGLFLCVPTVLALACSLRELRVPEGVRFGRAGRAIQAAGLFGVGLALLVVYKVQVFDAWSAKLNRPDESFWTLRTETPNTVKRVSRIVERDLRARPASDRPSPLLAQDWWSFKPLEFFTMRTTPMAMTNLENVSPDDWNARIRETLDAGGYVVGIEGREVDKAVRTLYPEPALASWQVNETGYIPPYRVYRLRR